jgi:predicted aspartyl protease
VPILDFGPPPSADLTELADSLVRHGPTLPVIVSPDIDADSVPVQYREVVDIPPLGQPAQARAVPALLDTGSALNCIDQRLADALGLTLIDRHPIAGVAGVGHANVYLASVIIPALAHTIAGAFTASNLAAGGGPHWVIIGRPLLREMILIYDGRLGRVTLCK